MGRALVQLERGRNLRQSERSLAFTQQIEHGEGPVQGLNFVGALRSVSRIVVLHAAKW
jgi:hypothetical protein